MQPETRDPAYLWDMRDAARRALDFAQGITFEQFVASDLLRSAVERQLIIVGEAARRISEPFRAAHPEIPWAPIVAQRNVLVHQYEQILAERIWTVATRDLPELV